MSSEGFMPHFPGLCTMCQRCKQATGTKGVLVSWQRRQLLLRLCSMIAIVWIVAEQYLLPLPPWAQSMSLLCQCCTWLQNFFGQWNASHNKARGFTCASPFGLVLNSGVPPVWPLPFHLVPGMNIHRVNPNLIPSLEPVPQNPQPEQS